MPGARLLTGVPQTETWVASAVWAANAPAGTTVSVSWQRDPGQASISSIIVPGSEVWNIVDVYIQAATTVKPQVLFFADGIRQPEAADLDSELITATARAGQFLRQPLSIDANAQLNIQAVNRVVAGGAGNTETFFIKVARTRFK